MDRHHHRRIINRIGIALVLFAIGILAYFEVRAHDNQSPAAFDQVSRWADWFQANQTASGRYQFFYFPGMYLPERDPWGNNLMIIYTQGRILDAVNIRSAGPDGRYFTPDDISVDRSMSKPPKPPPSD